jgi:Tol biopolymer transport system component
VSLAPGTHLGPYEVVAALGAGGMGEVYRARDPKLGRDVALKVLPGTFAADADRLARFEREARALAALNHPHIAQIYGAVDDAGGGAPAVHALAMELVEGEDLAAIIARGPLPLDEAVGIATQIADALAAAHERGVIHRDLKPANIKRRPDGTIKVLDFGLAKLVQPDTPEGLQQSAAQSPTITSPVLMTEAGVILGTAAYMSPEQARGRPADKRADIWAFGCVLFEMLAGRRAFEGDDVADVLGAAIHKAPAFERLPVSTPAHVRATIERCLEKDPNRRARDIADVGMALGGAFGSAAVPPQSPVRSRSLMLSMLVAALGGAVISAGGMLMLSRRDAAVPPVIHFQVQAPDQFRHANFFALSPDGRLMAFSARDARGATSLWLHALDSGQSRRLDRAGQVAGSMFWSPDGRFVGYTSAGVLYRIDVDGGPPQEVSGRLSGFAGGAWIGDDTILYGAVQHGLVKVSAMGSDPVPVTELDASREETGHTNPALLPDGRHFIYVRLSRTPRNSGIFVGSLDALPSAQPTRKLVSTTEQALFAPDANGGRLLFVRDSALLSQELDLDSLTLKGTPTTVLDRIGIGPVGYAQVSVSRSGALAFRAPDATFGGIPTWFDRAGRAQGSAVSSVSTPGVHPRLAPDGQRLALVSENSVWIHNLDGRPPIRLTAGGSLSPLWSPDGQQIVFEQFGAGGQGLYVLQADGSSSSPRRVSPAGHYHAHGFSTDGRELLAVFDNRTDASRASSWDIVRLPFPGPGDPVPVVATGASEGFSGAAVSADGRWLAYISDATGTEELWVRPYPGGGTALRLSSNGASEPAWPAGGRELLYLESGKLMSVRVDGTGETSRFGSPSMLFETAMVFAASQPPTYDVAADGRILLLKPLPARSPPIEIIVNWQTRPHESRGH